MIYERSVPLNVLDRFPASIFRSNDALLLPARMGGAALHFLAFIIITQDRERLVPISLGTNYTTSEYNTRLDELNTSLAFTFLAMFVTSCIFLTGILIRHECLHVVQGMLHIGGAALLLAVWQYDLHVDRVWHSLLFFNLLPAVIDTVALLAVRQRRMFWIGTGV